ncbi:hypothetical protein Hamer_G001122 [Homarus americanus]|uniref:Uncharacterized protein n=1 Tax=Homarus americanus TaxID=6706 RepID=A0A8J5N2Q3_HOMAM|nr:hypothetical protein Hamer_G001122 [Homarus americanus]
MGRHMALKTMTRQTHSVNYLVDGADVRDDRRSAQTARAYPSLYDPYVVLSGRSSASAPIRPLDPLCDPVHLGYIGRLRSSDQPLPGNYYVIGVILDTSSKPYWKNHFVIGEAMSFSPAVRHHDELYGPTYQNLKISLKSSRS